MIRHRFLVIGIATALTISTPHRAALAQQTPPVAAVTYRVDDNHQQVTLVDGDGKTLLTRQVSTPTIKVVVTRKVADPAHPDVHQTFLSLEDQNGTRLWTTLVPVVSPLTFNFNMESSVKGVLFSFTHDPTAASHTESPADDKVSDKDFPIVFVIGSDGRLVSMKAGGDEYKIVTGPNGAEIMSPVGKFSVATGPKGVVATGPNGMFGRVHLTPAGGSIEINGKTIPIEKVERDGKPYYSFPWNGHRVFVGAGCTFTVNPDGDLTIDASADTTKQP